MLDRNDFIATEEIAQIGNENFIYSVYQIDLDGYRVEFKVVVGKDTTDIFDYGIADGVYSKNSFQFRTSNDTIIILDRRQTGTFYYKTIKGTTLKHTKTLADI